MGGELLQDLPQKMVGDIQFLGNYALEDGSTVGSGGKVDDGLQPVFACPAENDFMSLLIGLSDLIV